jgi:hypothetical protein
MQQTTFASIPLINSNSKNNGVLERITFSANYFQQEEKKSILLNHYQQQKSGFIIMYHCTIIACHSANVNNTTPSERCFSETVSVGLLQPLKVTSHPLFNTQWLHVLGKAGK